MTSSNPAITVYRTQGCPFCVAAEQLLRGKGVEFEEVYLDSHPDRRGFVAEIKPGHTTVPLVVVGDQPLGGYDDLMALESRGALDAALQPSS